MLKITTPSQRRVNVPLTHRMATYDSSVRHVILDLDLIHPYTSLYHEWMTWEGIKDWKTCQERLLAPLLERCPVLLNRANWAQDFHKQGSSMWWTVWFKRWVDYTRIPGNLRDESWRFTMICQKYMKYTLKEVNFTSIYVTLAGQFSHPPFTIWHPSFEDQDIDTRGIFRDV